MFSSGKNFESLAIGYLIDSGRLRYDDKVITHWPEFGENGKEAVRIEDVLRHEAGLPFFGQTISQNDMERQNHYNDITSIF